MIPDYRATFSNGFVARPKRRGYSAKVPQFCYCVVLQRPDGSTCREYGFRNEAWLAELNMKQFIKQNSRRKLLFSEVAAVEPAGAS